MKKVFYFHLPKTAGTTLNNILSTKFEKVIDHIEGKPNSIDLLNSYDVVSGHVSYTRMSSILDLSQWVSLATFREPYSHLISHICWVRKLADEGEEERFKQHPKLFQDLALKMKDLDFANPADIIELINHFQDIKYFYFYNNQTFYMDSERRIEVAIKNMQSLSLVGITEDMNLFYRRLSAIFDWPLLETDVSVKNKNSNKYGFNILDERTREVLFPLVNKDLLLYKEATKLSIKE